MNVSAKLLFLITSVTALSWSGCGGSACESYLEALREKAQGCGAPAPPRADDALCREEDAKTAERLEDCVKASSCEDLKDSTFASRCLKG